MTDTITAYDPAALYAKWTAAAKDARWRYRDATMGEFHEAADRASAWSDGAAHVHTEADIAAYLTEQIQRDDTKRSARETYADMLNDVHTSTVEDEEPPPGAFDMSASWRPRPDRESDDAAAADVQGPAEAPGMTVRVVFSSGEDLHLTHLTDAVITDLTSQLQKGNPYVVRSGHTRQVILPGQINYITVY